MDLNYVQTQVKIAKYGDYVWWITMSTTVYSWKNKYIGTGIQLNNYQHSRLIHTKESCKCLNISHLCLMISSQWGEYKTSFPKWANTDLVLQELYFFPTLLTTADFLTIIIKDHDHNFFVVSEKWRDLIELIKIPLISTKTVFLSIPVADSFICSDCITY